MRSILKSICLSLLFLPFAMTSAAQQEEFTLRVPLTLAPDSSLQRLELPAHVLAALQTPDYRDLRIFSADGHAVAMSIIRPLASKINGLEIPLAVYELRDTENSDEVNELSLRIDQDRVSGKVSLSAHDTHPQVTEIVSGVLLDARQVKSPIRAVELVADFPQAKPINVNLQASSNLKSWRNIADSVFYQFEAQKFSTATRLEFSPTNLKGHYLRVTWSDNAGNKSGVTIAAAKLITADTLSKPARLSAELDKVEILNPHEVRFSLPFATPITAMQINAKSENIRLPLQVMGRNDSKRGWHRISSAVIFDMQLNGKKRSNNMIELPNISYREIKLLVDQRSAGFTSAPTISVLFEPRQIVFLASGESPFTLAAGLANAENAFMPLPSLIPDYKSGDELNLPTAQVADSNASKQTARIQTQASVESMPTRNMVL